MQWNQASRGNPSGHKLIQKMYSDAGYTMPHIVYWDLRATNTYNNKSDQVGTTMMSGFSQNPSPGDTRINTVTTAVVDRGDDNENLVAAVQASMPPEGADQQMKLTDG